HVRERLHASRARPLAQRLGLGALRVTGLARLAAGQLGARVLPAGLALGGRMLCAAGAPAPLTAVGAAAAGGDRVAEASAPTSSTARRRRVALLPGCIGRWMQPQVNAATVAVLQRAGCELVDVPARCCGALHMHAGDRRGAQALARSTITAFEAAGALDAIVVNAAGCGAAMKDYGALLADDPAWAERGARFAGRVRDALEWLAEIGLPPMTRRIETSVACQDACHAAHVQKLGGLQSKLLEAVPGLRVIAVDEADRCCGSAGLYNLLHARVAASILDSKLARWQQRGVQLVAAANTGCLLHIAAGAAARGVDVTAVHPIEILEAASR
ncbi:MAG TPA: heterodisulfide reductase-related iron-sulfur binding cluster, partial [Planctomycetota bacterium]|nr:heterodisulfide reductase-related iron-sulfur binding cluster [Planctomycetota bacterium]